MTPLCTLYRSNRCIRVIFAGTWRERREGERRREREIEEEGVRAYPVFLLVCDC